MLIDDIALTLQPQVGPRTAAYLLEHFGSAAAIYSASKEELEHRVMLRQDIARDIAKKQFHSAAEKEIRFCEKNEIHVLVSTSEQYPKLLKECQDYPHILYFKGEPEVLSKKSLSIVGTRRITSYGQKICERIVGELAEMFPDITIVSGLAFGVDGACHRAALSAGIPTVGVIANPLNDIYPSQHITLASQMVNSGGGVMSEYHSQSKTKGVNFVPRNRIIAGMSMGTLVVESPAKGGALITANMAEGYDRIVMAIPGRVGDTYSEGTNYMIKANKARMVCSAEDIAAELGWEIAQGDSGAGKPPVRDLSGLSDDARGLFECLPEGNPVSIDQLMDMSGLSMAELSSLILELEFEKMIRVMPGKMYEKA